MTHEPLGHYIEVWAGVHHNLKTKRTAKRLNIHPAQLVGHLVALWLWAIQNRWHGDLSGMTPGEIAEAAEWSGDASAFVAALKAQRWLKQDGDRLLINDWMKYARRFIEEHYGPRPDPQVADRKVASCDTQTRELRFATNGSSVVSSSTPDKNKNKNQRERSLPSPSSRAREIVDQYVSRTRSFAANPTSYRSCAKLIKDGHEAALVRSINTYVAVLRTKARERQYITMPHNFFGKAAIWTVYAVQTEPSASRVDDSDPAFARRGELYRACLDEGMPDKKARTESYKRWRAEGWPKED